MKGSRFKVLVHIMVVVLTVWQWATTAYSRPAIVSHTPRKGLSVVHNVYLTMSESSFTPSFLVGLFYLSDQSSFPYLQNISSFSAIRCALFYFIILNG